jgi:hypothetical protein
VFCEVSTKKVIKTAASLVGTHLVPDSRMRQPLLGDTQIARREVLGREVLGREVLGTGRCEKIDLAEFLVDTKCMPMPARTLLGHPGGIFYYGEFTPVL